MMMVFPRVQMDKYVHGEGPGELSAMLRLVAALQRPDARGALVGVSAWLQVTTVTPSTHSLIRGNLFFFSLMATKVTTQFVLISNIKAFV
jgi:hypothetical protein